MTWFFMGMLLAGSGSTNIGPGGGSFVKVYHRRSCDDYFLLSTNSIKKIGPVFNGRFSGYDYKKTQINTIDGHRYYLCKPFKKVIKSMQKVKK